MEKVGRYKIQSMIGKGGMGTVYKALDPVLGRTVALKVVEMPGSDKELSESQEIRDGLNEARLSSRLIHPNIVITYDAGFEKKMFYMALEYIDGRSLSSLSDESKGMPAKESAEIIFNVCHALDYIHARGLVHLDVKPANVMMTRLGEVKLMDFGIARLLKDKTEQKGVSGSAPYMSPEQAGAEGDVGHRSDIFSLGVVLYELVSGKKPFDGESPYQVMYKVLNDEPPPLSEVVPGVSSELSETVARAMCKKAEDRFASSKEFAEGLLPVIRGVDSKVLSSHEKKKVEALRRLVFFQYFQEDHLARILEISTWHNHSKGAWIIEESESDSNIYIIINGRASLVLKGEVDSYMTAGDCFGESSILFRKSRMAKVRAETDCLVMVVNASILSQESDSLQVGFLKEFYRKKTRQLVQTNLRLIQAGSVGR